MSSFEHMFYLLEVRLNMITEINYKPSLRCQTLPVSPFIRYSYMYMIYIHSHSSLLTA